jgi:uncharacterized protein (TIGR02145 family)
MKINNMMKKIHFLLLILFVSSCTSLKPTMSGTFTDKRDGHVYKWVKLKNQIWMAQNLDYQTDGAVYSTKSKDQKEIGTLYFGSFVSKLAPEGWHVPIDDEWQELEMAAGMSKEEAAHYEYRGNVEYDLLKGGSTKFNVLFTGTTTYKSRSGTKWEFVSFWTSTPVLKSLMTRSFRTDDNRIGKVMLGKGNSAYVRCVKNDTTTVGLVIDTVVKKKK